MGDHIAGLLHELERHVMADRTDRIEAIKAELKELGCDDKGKPLDAKKKAAPAKEKAVDSRPLETRGE